MKRKSETVVWGPVVGALAAILFFVSSADAVTTVKILHYFLDAPASGPESALVGDAAGNFYGTTDFSAPDTCGSAGCGTIFKLTRLSGGGYKYKVIHIFHGWDGERPTSSLVFDAQGNLYGTTYLGGAHNAGTVFELLPWGSGWKEKLLYSFKGGFKELGAPMSALTFDGNGNLYGACDYYGPQLAGGIFELTPSANGWNEEVLYTFTGGSDGGPHISNLVLDAAGNLYGTAFGGGTLGNGVVFELSPSGGKWIETVIHDFTGGADGAHPEGGVIFDAKGNLYGTTGFGPPSSCDGGLGCGTVFQLTPSGGDWILSVLHTFDGADGDGSSASLTFDTGGNLYGTTVSGGDGYGVVFRLSPSGSTWSETVLLTFNWFGGALPYGGVTFDKQGVLYGSASTGGAVSPGYGVLFTITQ